jgi:multiple sugar transport system permease protein
MIYPITLVAVLLRAIDVFKIFDIIYVLTGGGPGGTATMSMSLWVYLEGPVHYKYAYASAGGVILLFLSAFIFSLFLRILRGGVR